MAKVMTRLCAWMFFRLIKINPITKRIAVVVFKAALMPGKKLKSISVWILTRRIRPTTRKTTIDSTIAILFNFFSLFEFVVTVIRLLFRFSNEFCLWRFLWR